ncbi:hypothetical protein [Bacillus sp. SA1-12]|uniref:hypothetical protein n=1 Tax=Bacillus sp. SA1-12 TaxID=1455638 RepID=UPI0006976167|nr:hypothetical protein [Bacillus sp. SA1-12]
MELLTEIITNPIVWGILAWVFTKIFTSKKDDAPAEQPKKQVNQPKERKDSRPYPTPVKSTSEQKHRKEATQVIETVQQAYEKMKNLQPAKAINNNQAKEQQKKTQVNQKVSTSNAKRIINKNSLSVDKQKAVQGIIWSEILGPPRSQNPHYTRKRRHS